MDDHILPHRVRAILLDSKSNLILIKRVKPNQTPYWVAPGGSVEETDLSLQDSLRRELAEELGATAEVGQLVLELGPEHGGKLESLQSFFLCRLLVLNLEKRSGPEFSDPTRGHYQVETIPFKQNYLITLNILPTALKDFLLKLAAL